jgi:hypothetical protein
MLPPPVSPSEFELLCLDLWREIWQDHNAQSNARDGQPQANVDIFGRQDGNWVGVQCKKKDGLLHAKLSVQELKREVAGARLFISC